MKKFKTILEEIKVPLENTWYKQKKKVSTPEDKPEVAPSPAPEAAPVEKPQSKSIVMKGNTVQGANRVTPITPNIEMPKIQSGNGPKRKQQTQQLPSPTHTVKQGETARDLARKHGMSEREFLELNKGIKDPINIPQGTKVRTRK
jgi:LysM repeat protein